MASKDNKGSINLNALRDQQSKLQSAFKEIAKSTGGVKNQMADMRTILYGIEKGYIKLTSESSKLEKVLKNIASNKGLKENLQDIASITGLQGKALADFSAQHQKHRRDTAAANKISLEDQKTKITGSDKLIRAWTDQRDIIEEITDFQEIGSDALSDQLNFHKLTNNAIKRVKSSLDSNALIAMMTNQSVESMTANMKNLGVAAAAVDPILEDDPVTDLLREIGAVSDSLSAIGASEFTINGNVGNFESSVIAARSHLDNLYTAAQKGVNVRSSSVVPQAIAAEITGELINDADMASDFSNEVASLFSGDSVDIDVGLENVVRDSITALSGLESISKEQEAQANALMSLLVKYNKAQLSSFIIQEAHLQKDVVAKKEAIDLAHKQLALLQKHKGALDALSRTGEEFTSTLHNGFNKLFTPAQKGLLGIDQLVVNIGKEWSGAVNNITSDLASGFEETGSFAKSLMTNFGSMLGNVKKLINPWMIIAGVVAGLFAALTSVENATKNISKELGVSRGQALGLYKQSMQLTNSWDNQLTTQEDVLDVMKKHQEKYGVLLDISNKANQESIKFAANLGSQYGVAAGEVYGISQQFKMLGADSEVSDNLTSWLAKSSELSGIPFSTFTKDMAEASELIATHFDGMPKQAAKAVVATRRMGMSLQQVGKVMDASMNVSGFLGDMAEVNAMTGGMSDLSGVFEMRMSGADPAKIAEEVGAQWDKLPDSMKQNEFIAAKYAKTLGMSVEELKKGAKVREMSNSLSTDQQALLDKHLGSMSKMDLADSKSAMMAASRLDTQEKFGVAMSKLKGELMTSLLPLIEAFGEGLSAVLPVLGIIGKLLGAVGSTVAFILKPVTWLLKLVGGIADAMTSFSLEPLKQSFFGVLDDITGSVTDTFSSWQSILGTFFKFAIGGFILFKTGMLKHITGVYKIFPKMAKGITGIFSKGGVEAGGGFAKTMLGSLKGIGSKISEKLTGGGVFDKLKDKAGSVLGGMKDKTSGSVDAPSSIGSSVTDSLDSVGKSSSRLNKEVGTGVKDFLTNLAAGLKEMASMKVVGGALALIPASIGFVAMIPGYIGAKLISKIDGSALKGGLVGMAEGLEKMASGKVLLGSLALIGAGLAFTLMIPGAIGIAALSMAAPLAVGALTMLGIALTVFGTLMSSGVGAIGLLAFIGLAVGLGYAISKMAPSIEAIGSVLGGLGTVVSSVFSGITGIITTITDGFVDMFTALTSVSPIDLIGTAYGITAIGAALAAFGAGSAIGGIGSAIGSMFGGDPMAKLSELAKLADPLSIVAESISSLAENLKDLMATIDGVDVGNLEGMTKSLGGMAMTLSMSAITSNSPAAKLNNFMGGSKSNSGITNPLAKSIGPSHSAAAAVRSTGIQTIEPKPAPAPIVNPEVGLQQSNDTRKSNALMKELIREVKNSNGAPIVVKIGDLELRSLHKKMKSFN